MKSEVSWEFLRPLIAWRSRVPLTRFDRGKAFCVTAGSLALSHPPLPVPTFRIYPLFHTWPHPLLQYLHNRLKHHRIKSAPAFLLVSSTNAIRRLKVAYGWPRLSHQSNSNPPSPHHSQSGKPGPTPRRHLASRCDMNTPSPHVKR
jgi:hypothetical protein